MGVTQQIGRLDRYVEIVEYIVVNNTIGEDERTQQSIKSVWSQVLFKGSAEDFEDKVYSINLRDYVIHNDQTIIEKTVQDLAVIDGGKTYYVTGYDPDYGGRNMFTLLKCEYRG